MTTTGQSLKPCACDLRPQRSPWRRQSPAGPACWSSCGGPHMTCETLREPSVIVVGAADVHLLQLWQTHMTCETLFPVATCNYEAPLRLWLTPDTFKSACDECFHSVELCTAREKSLCSPAVWVQQAAQRCWVRRCCHLRRC